MARESKWPDIQTRLDEIKEWAERGVWEKDIAVNLGIALSTFNSYKNKYPELKAVLKCGRRPIVKKLENTLLKVAFGYTLTEKKEYTTIDKEGNTVKNIEKFTKQVGPSLGAICFALKNFDPEHFKDNPYMAHLKRKEFEFKKQQAEKANW